MANGFERYKISDQRLTASKVSTPGDSFIGRPNLVCDQRLTASKVSTQIPNPKFQNFSFVINALRHQRLVHGEAEKAFGV